MSSFFAHGMAGMTIWGFARRTAPFEAFQHRAWYATAAVVSFLPDLDSFIGLRHRGVTHTLGFALAAAGVIALCAATVHRKRALWLLLPLTLAIWLHGLMDLLVGAGPRVALFWPVWDEALPTIEAGLPVHGVPRSWDGLMRRLTERTLPRMAVEAGIFGPFFAASIVSRRSTQVLLIVAGAMTWLIYAIIR